MAKEFTDHKERFHSDVSIAFSSRWVEGGKTACRALSPELIQCLIRIERFRLLIQSSMKVLLPAVRRANWTLKSLKEFAEGILDSSCRYHEWRSSLLSQHAPRRVRVSVAASLFLFRKVIPKPMSKTEIKKAIASYIDKMTSVSPAMDPAFSAFCVRTMQKLFRPGWDKSWQRFRDTFTLPTSACSERSRKKGGVRGGDKGELRAEYRSFTEGSKMTLGQETEPMMIWTGGKWRLVTKFSARRSFLTPLHRVIYSHLSKKNWLLRGEATHDKFEEFVKVKDEVFVSGDYESATDNLNINLTFLMIDEMSKTSQHVPQSVWLEARKNLRNIFPNGQVQSCGQLMGSLLSFPLLCIANYLTFKWAVPRYVPLKINGDDIVFRCNEREKNRWFEVVGASGLTVSKGKTLVSSSGFSLNSTFFLSAFTYVKACPVIRSTCLFGGVEDPNQIAGRLKGVYAGGGFAGEQIRAFALREMRKQIWSSQRSVRRGLGAVVSWRTLAWSKLAERETFYNELGGRTIWRSRGRRLFPAELVTFTRDPEKDLPLRRKEWHQNAVPENYRRIKTFDYSLNDDPDFVTDMIECCWSKAPKIGEEQDLSAYWEAVREDTQVYVKPIDKRFARMAGMTPVEISAYYDRRTNTERDLRKRVWVKTHDEVAPAGR